MAVLKAELKRSTLWTVIVCLLLMSASGVLKGFDPLLNLVLDGTTEHLRGNVSYICLFFKLELMICPCLSQCPSAAEKEVCTVMSNCGEWGQSHFKLTLILKY